MTDDIKKKEDMIDELTNIIYGESADQDEDVMTMVGSSVLQRLKSGKVKEFGGTIKEIGQKSYYAVKNKNIPYKQATSKKFPDAISLQKYETAKKISAGLIDGTIEPKDVMFFFKKEEYPALKKQGFNFNAVKRTGKSGDYDLWSY